MPDVIEVDSLSTDARALVLLCTSLGAERGGADGRPIGPVAWSRLEDSLRRQSFSGPGDLLGLTSAEIARLLDIEPSVANGYARLLGRSGQLAFALDRLRSRGMWILTILDDAYPNALRERLVSWAPPILFGSGLVSVLGAGGIAIVGSRAADPGAMSFAERLATMAARSGTSVVSGGARGVDVAAMRAAFEGGGPVIGVLPEGVERRLRDAPTRSAVAAGQAVLVSPYHPSAPFSAGAAMGRNKIIYALSDVAVVVSSNEGSGGTWTGATEALKGAWVPVLVRNDPGVPDGNRALIDRGAAPLTSEALGTIESVEDMVAFAGASSRRAAERPTAYEQAGLFDDG